MPKMKITNCDIGSVMLGGEEFEDALLTVAAAGLIKQGTLLQRVGAKLEPLAAAPTDAPAVLSYDINPTAAGDVPIRALIAGHVNRTRLLMGDGSPVPDAILDALRDYSIIPIDVTQLGVYDNPPP